MGQGSRERFVPSAGFFDMDSAGWSQASAASVGSAGLVGDGERKAPKGRTPAKPSSMIDGIEDDFSLGALSGTVSLGVSKAQRAKIAKEQRAAAKAKAAKDASASAPSRQSGAPPSSASTATAVRTEQDVSAKLPAGAAAHPGGAGAGVAPAPITHPGDGDRAKELDDARPWEEPELWDDEPWEDPWGGPCAGPWDGPGSPPEPAPTSTACSEAPAAQLVATEDVAPPPAAPPSNLALLPAAAPEGPGEAARAQAPRDSKTDTIGQASSGEHTADAPAKEATSSVETWKQFTPAIIDRNRCLARIWFGGQGGQCGVPIPDGRDLCCAHGEFSPFGRVDGPVPANKVADFEAAYARRVAALPTPEKPAAKGKRAKQLTPDKMPSEAGRAKATPKAGGSKKRAGSKASAPDRDAKRPRRAEASTSLGPATTDRMPSQSTPAEQAAGQIGGTALPSVPPPVAGDSEDGPALDPSSQPTDGGAVASVAASQRSEGAGAMDEDDGPRSQTPASTGSTEWARFTPAEIDTSRCLGRIWNSGKGGQCSRKPTEGNRLCKMHQAQLGCGAVDGPIPGDKLKEFEAAAARSARDARGGEEAAKQRSRANKRPRVATGSVVDAAAGPPIHESTISACAGVGDGATGQLVESGPAATAEAAGGAEPTPAPEPERRLKQLAPKAAKPLSKKQKSAAAGAKDTIESKLPFGVNFVRLDLRRRKNTMAFKGSKESQIMRKHFTKEGRLKGKHFSKSGPQDDPSGRYVLHDSKAQRNKSRREHAMTRTTLVDARSYKVDSFSPAVGPELLSKLYEDKGDGGSGLGEIAETRPPDLIPLQLGETVAVPPPPATPVARVPMPFGRSDDAMHTDPTPSFAAACSEGCGSGSAGHGGSATSASAALETAAFLGDSSAIVSTADLAAAASGMDSCSNHAEASALVAVDTAGDVFRERGGGGPSHGNDNEETALVAVDGTGPGLEAAMDTVGPMSLKRPEEHTPADLKAVLRNYFGHDDFRPGQCEAVSSILAMKKTLLLLSTGSGKSLCYQLPAFLLREEGFTLVVSPLVSLMADQLLRLPHCLRGAVVSSQQTPEECRSVMKAVRARLIDVLFISPERLSLWAFDGCGLPPIALACVDEAHCVSEWSHNFRPDYLRLHEFLTGSLCAKRLLALTATATRPTTQSICNILRLDVVVRSDRSFSLQELLEEPTQPRVQRPNLTMDVKVVANEEVQVKELVQVLRSPEHARGSAIVYVWRRATADHLARQLRGYLRGGGDVRAYHGSLSPEVRRSVQFGFMRGRVRVVVATTAFGMGLDKPDIRLVVHFNVPKSIENYIQETGRCARDGGPGRCLALVTAKDFKSMRWMESGGGGGSAKASLMRRLLSLIFKSGAAGPQKRFELSDEAIAANALDGDFGCEVGREGSRPFFVAFEEKEAAGLLNCPEDELHSALVHFAHGAQGHVKLFSRFPTKLKMRFFKSDPEELMKQDPLLRKVLPMAKKHGPVYTLTTAQAVAVMGGRPSQLSNALWRAQGDDFTVEKAEFGYMVAVWKPADENQIEEWASRISSINATARVNSIGKVDAAFIALSRAFEKAEEAEAAAAARRRAAEMPVLTSGEEVHALTAGEELPAPLSGQAHPAITSGELTADNGESSASSAIVPAAGLPATPSAQLVATEGTSGGDADDLPSVDSVLRDVIDAYFAATENPSTVVAGGEQERNRLLKEALGSDFRVTAAAGADCPTSVAADVGVGMTGAIVPAEDARSRDSAAKVKRTVARLIMSAEWANSHTGDIQSLARAAAQILGGIGSVVFPATKWKAHECWGTFRDFGDFQHLEMLVEMALPPLLEGKRKMAFRQFQKEQAMEKANAMFGSGPH